VVGYLPQLDCHIVLDGKAMSKTLCTYLFDND
jgi:hypothetical protein